MSAFKNSIAINFLPIFLTIQKFLSHFSQFLKAKISKIFLGVALVMQLKQIHCGDKIPKTYVSEGHEIEIAFAVVNMYRDDRGLIYKFTYEATRARKSKRNASQFSKFY